MPATRVIVVWGSETNQSHNEIKELVKVWKSDGKIEIVKVLQGDVAADEFSDINSKNYDAIVVGCSSYGDGDAPSGYGKFLYQLYEASKGGEAPLKGMQHAVLGFGSTLYETFQNCPRISDKLLGEAGSRRCLERVEIDEMGEDNEKTIEKWSSEVVAALIAGVVGTDPVCDWTQPKAEIYNKNIGPDGYELGSGVVSGEKSSTQLLAIAVVAVGVGYYFYQKNLSAQEE